MVLVQSIDALMKEFLSTFWKRGEVASYGRQLSCYVVAGNDGLEEYVSADFFVRSRVMKDYVRGSSKR